MNLKKATGFLLVVLTFFTLNTASVEAALIGTKQEISMGKPVGVGDNDLTRKGILS